MQLHSSFQVLVEPVDHVRQGFLGTLHGSCIIFAVPHAPSMRHTRENLDEVTNLQTTRRKTIQDQKLHRNINSMPASEKNHWICPYPMKIEKDVSSSSMIWKVSVKVVVHIHE